MKVIEIKGVPHTLTQSDGKTFRIFAHQTKVIADSLISNEFKAEEKLGGLLLVPNNTKLTKKK